MLIIRVGIVSERSMGGGTNPGGTSGWAAAVTSERSGVGVRRRQDGSYAMKDLKVEITQVVEDDSEYEPGDSAGSTTLSGIAFRRAGGSEYGTEYKGEPLGMPIMALLPESPTESGSMSGSGRGVGHEIV